MVDDELQNFKSRIDLRAYAASQGYAEDRRHSFRGSTCMRHEGTDDKLFIKRNENGHYIYFSVRDDRDNGTIIDFCQFRLGLSLGAVRKELRPWLGHPPVSVPSFSPLPKTSKDRVLVEAEYAAMKPVSRHAYLENERCIPAALLQAERFSGLVRSDARSNAIFPHFDEAGLCGYEIKNQGFTGFASGGTKGLCETRENPNDTQLVFCESAIDFLSYASLFPSGTSRYVSIGGKPNPQQPELIRRAIARMPSGAEIVAAMDADADGGKLAEIVRKAFDLTGRSDLRFRAHQPLGFKDWNDQLRAVAPPSSADLFQPSGDERARSRQGAFETTRGGLRNSL